MRVAASHLTELADEARRLEREANSHERLGHFVLARDKRDAAKALRDQMAQLGAAAQRHQLVRFA